MVTNYPIAPRYDAPEEHEQLVEDAVGTSVVGRVRRLVCGMQGHDNLMKLGRDRIFLQCATCGYESPGWELTEAPPTVRLHGDAHRHALTRPRLVDERRVA